MSRRQKTCSKKDCKAKLPIRFFGIDTRSSDGFRSECMMCQQKSIMDCAARKLVLVSEEVEQWKRQIG